MDSTLLGYTIWFGHWFDGFWFESTSSTLNGSMGNSFLSHNLRLRGLSTSDPYAFILCPSTCFFFLLEKAKTCLEIKSEKEKGFFARLLDL